MPDTPASSWHRLELREVCQLLKADPDQGLSAGEAQRRLQELGPNRVSARQGTPEWRRFLRQFHQPLVYILLVASAVTAGLQEWVDASVIFGVVFINALIGWLQESKAEKAIEALHRLTVTEVSVRRDGRRQRVPSADLVPGDVVLLQSGDRVPADLRLFRVHRLQVDESALTGESLPVTKHPDRLKGDVVLADRKNLAYAGTLVSSGQAEGLVWATADRTETGRIAWLMAEAVELSTPLTRKIAEFSRLLLWIILGLAALGFGVGLLHGEPVIDLFLASVAIAVGAIPEGLPAAVTIVLAIGVGRMAKRRAIIRKLPAVETLGSTTVICTDKTGTLTENQMTVQQVFAGGETFTLTGGGYGTKGEIQREGSRLEASTCPALRECLLAGVLCNEAQLSVGEDGRPGIQGDPTEAALLVAGAKAGLVHAETHAGAPRLDMIPFESEHMFRATLHQAADGPMIYKVGAVERLLERCVDALGSDGRLGPLDREAVRQAVEAMADVGLRVLACARRSGGHVEGALGHEHVRGGMTFLGLQGMLDPPRAEAVRAVAACRQAGIQVKMITGDHAATARAIAARIGLAGTGAIRLVTGRDLERVPEADLPALAELTQVFARVAPEQKLRLVQALQARGHVVAMTGDGVNDAPALRQADIGIAMGVAGTEVAKNAADIVLTDDNFASIEAAVEEGRGVFDNLRKFIVWTLPTDLGEGLLILTALFLGLPLPVLPVQLLWVNMITAVLLGSTLVFEPREPGLMERPPRDPRRPLLTLSLILRTGLVSLFILGGGFWLYFHERKFSSEDAARTAVVNVIVLVEIGYLFCCRSLTRSAFQLGWLGNLPLLAGIAAMIVAQLFFTYSPVMNRLFHTTPLEARTWFLIAFFAFLCFLAVELEKFLHLAAGKSRPHSGKRSRKVRPEGMRSSDP